MAPLDLLTHPALFPLPFQRKESIEKEPDWIELWEGLSRKGTAILLESAGTPSEESRWTFLAGEPVLERVGVQRAWEAGVGSGAPMGDPPPEDLGNFLDRIAPERETEPQFPGALSEAWFGVVGYGADLGRKIPNHKLEAAPSTRSVPEYHFFKPGFLLAYDRIQKELYRFGRGSEAKHLQVTLPSLKLSELSPRLSQTQYEELVHKAQRFISSGDVYQVNLAQAFDGKLEGDPSSLYRVLRNLNPGPFMGIFRGRENTIISSSPERLAAGRGDWLEARPIAGTRPRGKDPEKDHGLWMELLQDEKEQAEHLMLLDLARNDLGRIAEYGSVQVLHHGRIESYAKVHHLVSVVEARRKKGVTMGRILGSLFPGGTITGCPKIRCMEVIRELEGSDRNFYTGSMGYIAPGPVFDLNILIRSFTIFADGSFEFFAGAGIVADSDPEREYLETLHKVEALAEALGTTLLGRAR